MRAQAQNAVSWALDERIRAATSGLSDIKLGDLMCAARPVSLYLASSLADRSRLAPLARALLGMTAAVLTTHERTDWIGRRKKQRLLFAIDECGLAGFKGLADSVALARSYNITYAIGAQSRAQLRARYGAAIVAACGVTVDFRPTDLREAQELSGIVGKHRYVEQVVSESIQYGFIPRVAGWSYSTRRVETETMPAEEILAWPARSLAIVTGQGQPWIGRYAPAFADPRYAELLALPAPAVAPLDLLDPEPEPDDSEDEADDDATVQPLRQPRRGKPPVAAELQL